MNQACIYQTSGLGCSEVQAGRGSLTLFVRRCNEQFLPSSSSCKIRTCEVTHEMRFGLNQSYVRWIRINPGTRCTKGQSSRLACSRKPALLTICRQIPCHPKPTAAKNDINFINKMTLCPTALNGSLHKQFDTVILSFLTKLYNKRLVGKEPFWNFATINIFVCVFDVTRTMQQIIVIYIFSCTSSYRFQRYHSRHNVSQSRVVRSRCNVS